MTENAVFYHEGRAESVRIFVEQAVMADTQTDHDVQIGFFFIQIFCLQDRIADVRTEFFLLRVEADYRLSDRADFAGHADDVVAFVAEDRSGSAGLFQKPHAGGDAEFFRADLPGEFADFLYAGGLAVVFVFDCGGCLCNEAVLRVVCVFVQGIRDEGVAFF